VANASTHFGFVVREIGLCPKPSAMARKLAGWPSQVSFGGRLQL